MNPSELQSYFAAKLQSLGLKENPNGFAQNIPAHTADLTYSFEPGQATVTTANQMASRFSMPVELSIYFKDYRTETDLRTVAFKKMEDIFGLLLAPERSLGPGGFSIQPRAVRIEPLASQNMATAIMKLQFDVSLYIQFRGLDGKRE